MIDSKAKLASYIRSQLGEPVITIELTEQQISEVIDDTIRLYTEVVYGDYEDSVLLTQGHFDHFGKIYLPKFVSILQVQPAANPLKNCGVVGFPGNLGFMETSGNPNFPYNWNNISRTLTILAHPIPDLLVVGLTRYEANDLRDHIFDETWVKSFAKAKTKNLWGHVVGKYSQNLVGGATINFDRLISESETEMEKLIEELHDKWVDPAPVLVG